MNTNLVSSIRMAFFFTLVFLTGSSFTTEPFSIEDTPPRWELLGKRKINYGLDRDEILVTRAEGVFTAIKLRIENSPINMHRCVIHFANGGTQEVELRNNIPAGGETRVIDITGNRRIIQKVVFWYDTKNIASRKGVIELWGRH